MNSRGIVIETAKGSLVVLTEEGSFRRVKRMGDERIGHEIIVTPDRRLRRFPRSLLVTAASIILLLAFPALWSAKAGAHPIVAYLSIDVNPSIEIGVDRKLNVQRLAAVSNDAGPLIEGIDYKGRPVEEVMDSLAQRLAESPYLEESESEIVLAGVMLTPEAEEALELLGSRAKEAFQSAAGDSSELRVTMLKSTIETRAEALQLGISTGRMALYLLAKSQGYEVSLEQFRRGDIGETASWDGGVNALISGVAAGDPQRPIVEMGRRMGKASKDARMDPE